MSKGLPAVSLNRQVSASQQIPEQDRVHATANMNSDNNDTRLLPQISLPQRRQRTDSTDQVHKGLLHYGAPTDFGRVAVEDSELTLPLDIQELEHAWTHAVLEQSPAVPDVLPSSVESKESDIQKQQTMKLKNASLSAQTALTRPSTAQKRAYLESKQLHQIAQARVLVLFKALIAFGLFSGTACVIWLLFAQNTLYLSIMFLILTFMLCCILRSSLHDYSQLKLEKLKTTLYLEAIRKTDRYPLRE